MFCSLRVSLLLNILYFHLKYYQVLITQHIISTLWNTILYICFSNLKVVSYNLKRMWKMFKSKTRKISHWLKCLMYRHEDLSSVFQYLHKIYMSFHAPITLGLGETKRYRDSGGQDIHRPVSLEKVVNLRLIWRALENDMQSHMHGHETISEHIYAYTWVYKHTHIHTHNKTNLV